MKRSYAFFLSLMILSAGFFMCPVQALEPSDASADTTVYTIELNDANAIESLKKQVIEQAADKGSLFALEDIDLVNSELSVEGLDLTRCGMQEISIRCNLKLKTTATTVYDSGYGCGYHRANHYLKI